MKLKAIVEDPKILCDIFDLCRRMQHHCTLSLQAETTRIFSTVEHLQDAAHVWVECKTDRVFRSFRCQSPYPHNSIVCDVLDTKHLCQVLKNAERLRGEGYGREVRLSKQVNGGQAIPILTFTFRSPKGVKQERNDIPIQLRSHAEIEALEIPSVDEEESVHVVVPHMSELFHFVETLRSVRGCDHIFFSSRVHPCSSGAGRVSSSPLRARRRLEDFNEEDEDEEGVPHRTAEEEVDGEEEDAQGPSSSLFASLEMEATHPYASLRLRYRKVQRIPPPPTYEDDTEEEEEDEEGSNGGHSTALSTNKQSRTSRQSEAGEELPEKNKPNRKKEVQGNARTEASVTIAVKKFVPFISAIRSLDLSALSIHLVHEQALVFCFRHADCASVAAYIPAVVPELIG